MLIKDPQGPSTPPYTYYKAARHATTPMNGKFYAAKAIPQRQEPFATPGALP